MQEKGFDGLGVVLTAEDPYVGGDVDDCIHDGKVAPWAQRIVEQLATYAEVSPSGRGLRLFARGRLPEGRRKRGHIEMYDHARYLTVTGHHLGTAPPTIEERTAELVALHRAVFGEGRPNGGARPEYARRTGGPSDTVWERLRSEPRLRDLFESDHAALGFPSESECDQSLANHLAIRGVDGGDSESVLRERRACIDRKAKHDGYFRSTVEQALAWAASRDTGGRPGAEDEPPPAEQAPEGVDAETDEHLTDLGNARRLVADHGRDLRYVALHGYWYLWDGTRFVRDDTGKTVRRAQDTVRRLWGQGLAMPGGPDRQAFLRRAAASEAEPRIRRMLALARAQSEVAIRTDDLDADPWLLATPSGTVELRGTPRLREARRRDLLTRSTAAGYNPNARAPSWERFLERVLPDPEVRAFVQRAAGYSLTGRTTEHVVLILWGSGSNGKSTFVEALLHALGDYGQSTPTETLLARRETSIPNDLAALRGCRLVTAVETGEGRRLAESKIKAMTGGDTISARFMRAEWFTFTPEFVLWLATNHKPEVRGTDHAIWRRIRLVPFTETIPDAEQDKGLPDRLRAEAAGILRWAVDGCAEWQRVGLAAPDAVRAATETYRAEQDVLGGFLGERCVQGPERWCPAGQLFKTWSAWCEASGERPGSQKRFGARLLERGFERDRVGHEGRRVWRGLDLITQSGSAEC